MKAANPGTGCFVQDVATRLSAALLVASTALALALALAFALQPATQAWADDLGDSFVVAAAQQDGSYVLEPTVIPYKSGDTVKDALQRADVGVEFTSTGTIDAICGVKPSAGAYQYYFSDYESHENALLDSVAANSITALYVSSADVGAISQGQVDLLECVRIFAVRTDGLKKYPDAVSANTRCIESLPAATSAQASAMAADFRQAIEAYDAIMAGPKRTITFAVTCDGSPYQAASVTLTDVYGNVTQAQRTTGGTYVAQVVDGFYSYEVMDESGLDGVRCTLMKVDADAQVQSAIPADEWFDSVTMRVRSNDNQPCSTNGTRASQRKSQVLQNIVPDAVKPLADLAVFATPAAAVTEGGLSSYPLYAVYQGTDGEEHAEQIAYNSNTYRPPYLVESGPEGTELSYEVRHPLDNSLLVNQVQICPATIMRSATLAGLKVMEGQMQLLAEFQPYKANYDVYTSADQLDFAPQAFGSAEEGYGTTVDGTAASEGPVSIPVPESARTTPKSVQVRVMLNNASTSAATYTVRVHKVDASSVTVQHAAGVSVELRNEAGGTVQPVGQSSTSATYKLLNGHGYTYVATKDDYYHATAAFDASDGLVVQAATPETDDAVSSFALGQDNLWGKGATAKALFDPDSAISTLHDQHFFVPDYFSSQSWLRAYPSALAAASACTYEASYERQDTGAPATVAFTPAQETPGSLRISAGLQGFATASGYSNTACFTVTTRTDAATQVTYSQDYYITAKRVLTLPDLAVTDGSNAYALMTAETADSDSPTYGFARDVRDYVIAVPEGTEAVSVRFTFPRPVSEAVVAKGGYSVAIDGAEFAYAAGATRSQRVALDASQHEQLVPVTVRHAHPDTPDATYRITVRQMPNVDVRFNTVPADATVTVRDGVTGLRVNRQGDGSFSLISGYTYSYTVAARGYVGQTQDFMAYDGLEQDVTLSAAPSNPTIDAGIKSHWPYFRADANNNAVIDAKTPIPAANTADDPLLYWVTRLGESFDSGAAGCPILVDGYLYSYAGNKIFKLDTVTGQMVAQGTMVGTSSFAITPMTYAEGMVFVALSNGRIEAFNAATLESLWVYTSPNGGQPNCPITYHDGCIYTGFWNWANVCDFVCLTITDEDPTTPGSAVVDDAAHPGRTKTVVQDAKVALWSFPHAGGFYWAGAWAGDDYIIVGSDDASITAGLEVSDEEKASGSLYSLDPQTGEVIDELNEYPGGVSVGNIRSTVTYDPQTDRYYYCGRGGYLCSVAVGADGRFDHGSAKAIRLRNTATDGLVSATSTPVIYNGRAYVGADHGAYNAYEGQSIDVVDLATSSVAYTVDMQGRAQASGLLTTGYVDEDGYAYIYYIDNYSPGKLRCFKDKPGQTRVVDASAESYTSGNTTTTYSNMAQVVFCPQGAQAQWCICSPIADEYGTIYFKNDSSYMMAVGQPITKLEVVQEPDVTAYGVGESFNPEGMKVVATYANGVTRDVSAYVDYPTEAFEDEGAVEVPIVFPYTMYQSGASAQDIGEAPGYNYPKPSTTVRVTVGSEVAPRLVTAELPQAQATDGITGATTPYEVQLQATGAPRSFTWTLDGVLPAGLSFDATTGAIAGTPAQGTGGSYPLEITVSNGVGQPATASYTLEVSERPTVTGTSRELAIRAGEPFSYQVRATGWPLPLEYALQEGFVSSQGWVSHTPEGLSIDPQTGLISGTTYETGSFRMRAYASNEVGISVPVNLRVAVSGQAQVLTGALPTGVLGTGYEATLEAQGYPAPTWSWEAAEGSQLPAGIELDASTGALTGTPSAAGSYRVAVTAANAQGGDTRVLVLEIAASSTAPSIVTTELARAALDETYNAPLAVTGAPSPNVTVTGLPAGLAFDARVGAIAGTPTVAGSFDVEVSASNAQGTAQRSFTLVVAVPPTIQTDVLGQATDEAETGYVVAGEPASIALDVQGSPEPEISVTGLPAGLSFDAASKRIVGMSEQPDAEGATVTVHASNGVGEAVERSYTLCTYVAPQTTEETWQPALLNQAYNQDLGLQGLPAPQVIITGLASGLHYDKQAHAIVGTPTMAGTFNVSVRVANVVGESQKTYQLVVGSAPAIGLWALPDATEDAPYTVPLNVTGSPAPQVSVEGLPAGLTYDARNGVITGATGALGTHAVTIVASNGVGADARKELSLAVRGELSLKDDALATAVVGEPYEAQLTFSHPVSSAQLAGLPAGLAFSCDEGSKTLAITGTPTGKPGAYTLALDAEAISGAVLESQLQLVLEPAEMAVSMKATATLAPWLKGERTSVDLKEALQVKGRPAHYTFAVAAGSALPKGVTLSGDGVLAGSAAMEGAYAFQISCANGIGSAASALVSLEVTGSPESERLTVPQGLVGKPYAGQVDLGGYPAPTYSWEAADGSKLPTGLSLDAGTGAIGGTPAQPGIFDALVTARNDSGSKTVHIAVVVKGAIADALIQAPSQMPYTGKAIEPPLDILEPEWAATASSGGTLTAGTMRQKLVQGRDYQLSYENNVEVGQARVIVTGMGTYTGTAEVSFDIVKAAQPMVVKVAKKSFAIKYAKLKKKKQTTPKTLKVTKAKGKVTYAKVKVNKKKLASMFTVNKKTGKITVAKKTKKGTYKVTIKVKAAGNAHYQSGTKNVVVKVVVK